MQWDKNEFIKPADQVLLNRLAELGQGFDSRTGARLTHSEQLAAVNQYTQLKDRLHAASLEAERIRSQNETDRERIKVQAEVDRERIRTSESVDRERIASQERQHNDQMRLEAGRLAFEYARLEVAKAELLVRAIEAVAAGGADTAKQIGSYVEELGQKLLGVPVVLPTMLEDKS